MIMQGAAIPTVDPDGTVAIVYTTVENKTSLPVSF
jgi:hypothetical protein